MKNVVDIAYSWIGTPYCYGASKKKVGVDCVRFILAVFKEAELIPKGVSPPHQHVDWIYGKNVDKDVFKRYIMKYAFEINYDNREPGDVVTFYYNGIESHMGIIVDDDCVIHAMADRAVVKNRLRIMNNICMVYRANGN